MVIDGAGAISVTNGYLAAIVDTHDLVRIRKEESLPGRSKVVNVVVHETMLVAGAAR
jgi:hypothetical protein